MHKNKSRFSYSHPSGETIEARVIGQPCSQGLPLLPPRARGAGDREACHPTRLVVYALRPIPPALTL